MPQKSNDFSPCVRVGTFVQGMDRISGYLKSRIPVGAWYWISVRIPDILNIWYIIYKILSNLHRLFKTCTEIFVHRHHTFWFYRNPVISTCIHFTGKLLCQLSFLYLFPTFVYPLIYLSISFSNCISLFHFLSDSFFLSNCSRKLKMHKMVIKVDIFW